MNDCWMMWMIRTVSPLRALSPGVLRRWYKPSWVTLKQMMNDFRMKWNESYRSFSIMDSMTAKWDFVLGMTPKTPEWCQNEWSDRNFLTKGLWLEFLKSSALDQSEASILGSRPIGSLDFGHIFSVSKIWSLPIQSQLDNWLLIHFNNSKSNTNWLQIELKLISQPISINIQSETNWLQIRYQSTSILITIDSQSETNWHPIWYRLTPNPVSSQRRLLGRFPL